MCYINATDTFHDCSPYISCCLVIEHLEVVVVRILLHNWLATGGHTLQDLSPRGISDESVWSLNWFPTQMTRYHALNRQTDKNGSLQEMSDASCSLKQTFQDFSSAHPEPPLPWCPLHVMSLKIIKWCPVFWTVLSLVLRVGEEWQVFCC